MVGIPPRCPFCGASPFVTFLRGQVTRWGRVWYWPFKKQAPYAVICYFCKQIVSYEYTPVYDPMGVLHLSEAEKHISLRQIAARPRFGR